MNNDLISREYVEKIIKSEFVDLHDGTEEWRTYVNDTCENILNKVHNAPTVEEAEEPFITECRNTAIKENLPLYFVYYEETGILEIYVTETKELFEKRHCHKNLSDFSFKGIVTEYLDWYLDWKTEYSNWEDVAKND